MARADRLERLDKRRSELEADYIEALVAALEVTAAGKWGLFDHNADKIMRAATAPVIESLTELADEIAEAREQLFMEPFALHEEFMASRGKPPANAVGEPKQARAWLERLKSASKA
ncbi:MAG: hypothetical protein B7X90_04075 [Novosphingobium sp. 17-62-19]|uniref:hypothetical protein n=1 Tax=Novosphingobium sp. 17-62-19 TaxID=1970406 RepID=UPI000BCD6702|nr:hypothetical protein [Novosphingobium sp. 17-62-19]OYX95356.1 MAG: hypothetical protein B7Y74_04510 [Novosphingobium sp. 35-62-5]OZA20971.1 MAG: hypothetical protein B7X90_04075 [Novosphingobium sp. 17-62-19]HQS95464.1 hypothetical protein [Novosphingobium sp.]